VCLGPDNQEIDYVYANCLLTFPNPAPLNLGQDWRVF
jgi:hypothetical protein